jgi:hypothetical protein
MPPATNEQIRGDALRGAKRRFSLRMMLLAFLPLALCFTLAAELWQACTRPRVVLTITGRDAPRVRAWTILGVDGASAVRLDPVYESILPSWCGGPRGPTWKEIVSGRHDRYGVFAILQDRQQESLRVYWISAHDVEVNRLLLGRSRIVVDLDKSDRVAVPTVAELKDWGFEYEVEHFIRAGLIAREGTQMEF